LILDDTHGGFHKVLLFEQDKIIMNPINIGHFSIQFLTQGRSIEVDWIQLNS
jgi:hypothetical protein